MERIYKENTVIAKCVLLFSICCILNSCRNKAENETFLLPNDYNGNVIIFYGEENGSSKKYDEDGNRVYEIPNDGILNTKFEQENGFRNAVYKRKNGQILRYLWPSDPVWKDTVNTSSIYKDSVYVYTSRSSKGASWFNVGKPQNVEYWADKISKKLESLSEPIILKDGDSTKNFKHNKLFDN